MTVQETAPAIVVRDGAPGDASGVVAIYNSYILSSHATFELEVIEARQMADRIRETLDMGMPYIVAEIDGSIAGYAYGRPFRPRPGYRFAVEVAVYVAREFHRRRVGDSLYRRLIPRLFDDGAHSLIATIALPNEASVRLHEKFGFVRSGELRQVGRKFDRWVDIGHWQLLGPEC